MVLKNGLSRMRGDSHVRFLGGGGAAMRRCYPTPWYVEGTASRPAPCVERKSQRARTLAGSKPQNHGYLEGAVLTPREPTAVGAELRKAFNAKGEF